jgi:hypothetical protein
MSKASITNRRPRQNQLSKSAPAGHRLDVTAGQVLLGTIERIPGGYRARNATDKRLGDYRTQIEAMTACLEAAHRPTAFHLTLSPGQIGITGKSAKLGGRHG